MRTPAHKNDKRLDVFDLESNKTFRSVWTVFFLWRKVSAIAFAHV